MGLLARLLGSPKALDEAISGVSKGLDSLIYTRQEKAEDLRADTAEFRSAMVEWMTNSQGQNLSRRVLAFAISGTWLVMYIAATLLDVMSIFSEEMSAKFKLASSAIDERLFSMNGAVMLIVGFYFAAPHLSKIIGPAMARFSGSKSE